MCFAKWMAINQTFLLQEVGLSITSLSPPHLLSTPSTASAVPKGTEPFHFTCPSATLNTIPEFSRSDGLSDSYVQIGVFCRKCVWLAEACHSGRMAEGTQSFCIHSADIEILIHSRLITELLKFASFCLSVSSKSEHSHIVVVYHSTYRSAACL